MGEYLKTIDYVIFVLVMIGGIWGAIKGFIDEVSSKCGYVLGFLLAAMFTRTLSSKLIEQFGLPLWFASFICYFIIFMVGYSALKGFGSALDGIFESANIAIIDNILGFVLGVVESILIIGILEMLMNYQSLFDFGTLFSDSFFSTRLIGPLVNWCLSIAEGVV